MITDNSKLTKMQLELLRGFKHITDEEQLKEVKSLLNLYFREKLNSAIEKEESERNYSADIYIKWLNSAK